MYVVIDTFIGKRDDRNRALVVEGESSKWSPTWGTEGLESKAKALGFFWSPGRSMCGFETDHIAQTHTTAGWVIESRLRVWLPRATWTRKGTVSTDVEKELLQRKVWFSAQKELHLCRFCIQGRALFVFDELKGKGGNWNYEDGASMGIFWWAAHLSLHYD